MVKSEVYSQVRELVKSRYLKWYDELRKIQLADLSVNVFLAAAMEMKSAKEIMTFFFMRHIERSSLQSSLP